MDKKVVQELNKEMKSLKDMTPAERSLYGRCLNEKTKRLKLEAKTNLPI